MLNRKDLIASGVALAAANMPPITAPTQSADAQRAEANAIEEIVVTSRKRGDEVLQDGPATITVFERKR
jgi:hypothetical protein